MPGFRSRSQNATPVWLADDDGIALPDIGAAPRLTSALDRSSTAGTTSGVLAPANTSRKGLNIQNISANTLGVNERGDAAVIGSPGTYTVPAGGSATIRTTNAITVVASAAGSAFTATEF